VRENYKAKGIENLVAGSIGNYSCYHSGDQSYYKNTTHPFNTPELIFQSFHKPRFEAFVDKTDVDFLAIET